MANIIMDIEKGVEAAATDILHWLAGATKALSLAPKEIAALGVLLGAVSTAVTDASSAASSAGLNIALDEKVLADIKAVWPDLVAAFAVVGVKI